MGDWALHYRAFISYSHKDEEFARWLHTRLETYRVPAALVGGQTMRGQVPARLSPIFRDRDELPAATSLSAAVEAALERTAALIVVCSPHSAASQWVNREIELFRTLHSDGLILLALVEGEPDTAFPAALFAPLPGSQALAQSSASNAEPLAADFRSEGDGRKLGLLKLVAGLTGLPLGKLAQRDEQRKMRRVTVVTALVGCVAVIMAAMTVFAIQSRNDAKQQRGQAEDLVRFMITDMRSKLDDVGRLDLLAVGNERALDYYRGQDLSDLDPQSLALRSQILLAIGEDLEKGGDLAGALAAFEEAFATTQFLLASDPDNPELIYADAQSAFWVGFAAMREFDNDRAKAAFERYAAHANRLIAMDPDNVDWQMEAGYAASNLGTITQSMSGDRDEMLALFLEANRLFEAVAKVRPEDTDIALEVADSYLWLSTAYRALGRFEEGRRALVKQRGLLLGLIAKDPDNADFSRFLIHHKHAFARLEDLAGNTQEALKLYRENYAIAAQELAVDPQNAELQKRKMSALLHIEMLDRGAALALGEGPACSPANQALDPEFDLYCAIIGKDRHLEPETFAMACRLGENGRTLRHGLNLNQSAFHSTSECGTLQ